MEGAHGGGAQDVMAVGLAIPVNVELADVAVARLGGRQAAQDGEMFGAGNGRTARGGADYPQDFPRTKRRPDCPYSVRQDIAWRR